VGLTKMKTRALPVKCPSCGESLKVKRLECALCASAVEGDFTLPAVARLTYDEQTFLISLVQFSGSLKDLARLYGVSYPTVRNRLDALIEKLKVLTADPMPPEDVQETEA